MVTHYFAISAYSLPRCISNGIVVTLCSGVSVGDYNADGMDDLFCHTSDGRTTVAISTVTGKRIYKF